MQSPYSSPAFCIPSVPAARRSIGTCQPPCHASAQARVGGPERTLLAGCRTGLWVDNKCDHTVLLAVSSLLEDDAGMKDDYCRNGIVLPNVVSSEYKEWCTRAWFEFEPNDGGYVTFTNNRFVFIYARIKEDSSYSWRGESSDEPWLDVDTGKVCSESSSASTCKHFKKASGGAAFSVSSQPLSWPWWSCYHGGRLQHQPLHTVKLQVNQRNVPVVPCIHLNPPCMVATCSWTLGKAALLNSLTPWTAPTTRETPALAQSLAQTPRHHHLVSVHSTFARIARRRKS